MYSTRSPSGGPRCRHRSGQNRRHFSEARFFASDTAALDAFGRRLYERENRYYSSLGQQMPPEYLLAISGGGDNGAFGAGVLVGWSENGTRPSFRIVTGISTGALIAPLAFVGPQCDA